MAKKVKSFAVDEDIYEALFSKFKDNYVDITISYCLNKYIKEFLQYIQTVENSIKDSSLKIPMAFVIESVAREPIFKILETEARPGELESSLETELNELQKKYDAHIKRNPAAAVDFANSEIENEVSISTFLTYIGKAIVKKIKNRQELTDDQYIELIREVGGKEFHKYLREKTGPVLEKYDPDLKDLMKKIKGNSQAKIKKSK